MNENQTVKDRILLFINYLGIGQSKFEKSCGLSNGYINNSKGNFGAKKIDDILKNYPELNHIWLLTGEGEMLLKTEAKAEQTGVLAKKPNEVYLLPVSAQAGSLNDFVASVYAGQCDSILSPIAGAELALTVAGDSMTPEYPNGSIIFIKRINERAFINWGNVYVLDTCNGIIVKKVYPTEEVAILQCVSINSAYPPFTVNMADIYGMYRVLLCMSIK